MPLSNVYYNLGCLYNEHNLIPKALQYFDQSLQLNHTQLPALYELSRILLISHNFEQAQQRILQYLKVSEQTGLDYIENGPGYLLYALLFLLQNDMQTF